MDYIPVNTQHHRFLDLTGLLFSRLKVLELLGKRPVGNQSRFVTVWRCQCICGEVLPVRAESLMNGDTTSCGCLKAEIISKRNVGNATHGLCDTAEYRAWKGAKERVTSISPNFVSYQSLGVRMCKRWLESSKAFLEDMGRKPSPEHSLDRINNKAHYSCGQCPQYLKMGWPPNCRWATATQQTQNRRNAKTIDSQGRTYTLKEFCEMHSLKYVTGYKWLKSGMSSDEMISRLRVVG